MMFIDGFRKVISNEAVNLKMDKDDMEFAHQFFVQGQERLLEFIKRKVMLQLNFSEAAFYYVIVFKSYDVLHCSVSKATYVFSYCHF